MLGLPAAESRVCWLDLSRTSPGDDRRS